MLIDSPRLTDADRDHWQRLARYDALLADDPHLTRLASAATRTITEFAATGACLAGVSWGKDSTVIAHLTYTAVPQVPIVWARAQRRENPDCARVRDAFLAAYPARYEERVYDWRQPLPTDPGWRADQPGDDALTRTLGRLHDGRRITGVRAQESTKRRLSAATHGDATHRSCRPILRWTHEQVFAYLHRHNLPVHPAYAMTYGGQLDRGQVRVHALGTIVGDLGWEQTYYREVS